MLSSAVLRLGSLTPNTRLQASCFAKIGIMKEVFSLQTKTSALCMLSLLSNYSCVTAHKWKTMIYVPMILWLLCSGRCQP